MNSKWATLIFAFVWFLVYCFTGNTHTLVISMVFLTGHYVISGVEEVFNDQAE